MKLHIPSPLKGPGVYPICERGKELKYLSFTLVELGGNFREHSFETGEEEVVLSFYTGPVRVQVESQVGRISFDVPPRSTIAEPGTMIYVPAASRVRLAALDEAARIAITGAEGTTEVPPEMIAPHQAVKNVVGKDNWQRTVYTHLADNIPAKSLIAGETINIPGGWSSYPPHKHDRHNPPREVPMEEVYFFQIEPHQGFGFMRIYTAEDDPEPFDYAFAIQHGDTVLIPKGYHPVAAAAGYTLNYTWVLAGEGRKYGAWSDDPRHAWVKQAQ